MEPVGKWSHLIGNAVEQNAEITVGQHSTTFNVLFSLLFIIFDSIVFDILFSYLMVSLCWEVKRVGGRRGGGGVSRSWNAEGFGPDGRALAANFKAA